MSSKKSADLSSSLVAVKGRAGPSADATGRKPETSPALSPASAPLNFKVDADFRRRFRQRAAEADLKLNELLREALDAVQTAGGIRSWTIDTDDLVHVVPVRSAAQQRHLQRQSRKPDGTA